MSEPAPPPPETGSGDSLASADGAASSVADALSRVAEGLAGEPVLLAGFGAMLLVDVAGVALGGTFLLVSSLIFGAYAVSLVAYLLLRRSGAADPADPADRPSTDVRTLGVGGARIRNLGGRMRAVLRFSRDIEIVDSRVPSTPTTPVEPPRPTPVSEPRSPAPREPYTPSLAGARDRVLEAARGRSRGRGVRLEVVADSGCGKTLLLEEVAAALKQDGMLVLFITATAPQYGTGASLGEAEREMADYAACRRLIDALATDVHRAYAPEAGEEPLLDETRGLELETALLSARDTRPQFNLHVGVSRSSHVRIGVDGATGPSWLLEMLRQVTGALDRVTRTRPTALLVDDTHAVAGTAVGTWLTGVLEALSAAVVVHAGRPTSGAARSPGVPRIRLDLLSADETIAFVRERLAAVGWASAAATEAAREIAVLTRGHPIGMATCTRIACDSLSADTSAAEVRSMLLGGARYWDDDAFEAVRTYVDDTAAAIAGRPIALFDLLVVLRRCTAKILTAVLGEREGPIEEQASRLYDWLSGCAFVTHFDDDVSEGWRLHDYLRENLDRRFRRTRPTEYARVHAAVERYYRTRMNFDEERTELGEQPANAAGARYESPDWQRDSQEWLHHVGLLPREDFEAGERAMIRLFLEAFFWWDTEVPSSYCDQLIAAYRALPGGSGLRWVPWLDQLRTGYVSGRINQAPGRDRERWEQAGEALNALWTHLRLRRGHVPADPALRRIYILHCQLRGDVTWFGSDGTEADRERAAAWFRASDDACTGEKERWMGNWAAWQVGELWATTDPARARALLEGLEERIVDEEDYELPVWLAGTFADIAWAENDPRRAFDAHLRAVLHGFVYHVRQETYEQYPNRYTASLYGSVLTALERQAQAADDAGLTQEVAAAKARGRAFFAPYWRHIGQDPGDAFGQPRPPAEADLGTRLTAFFERAEWMLRHMADELEKSVEEPVPDPPTP